MSQSLRNALMQGPDWHEKQQGYEVVYRTAYSNIHMHIKYLFRTGIGPLSITLNFLNIS